MNAFYIMPIVGLMILGFLPQLVTIAESSSDKAIEFADDMNSAIDCATTARPLEECSPELYEHDFTEEIDETLKLTEEIIALSADYASEIEVIEEEDIIIIKFK